MPTIRQHPVPRSAASSPLDARRARAHHFWQQGVEHASRGRLEQACDAFRQATRLEPGDGLFWLNLGLAASRLGRRDEAITAARRALAIEPGMVLACEFVVGQLIGAHRCAEAVQQIDALPPGVPRSRDLLQQLVTALLEVGDKTRAVEAAMQAVGADLSHPYSHYLLGCALAELQLHEQAGEAFKTAWTLDPTRLDALENSVHRRKYACRWDGLESDVQAIVQAHAAGTAKRSLPFTLVAMPVSAATQRVSAAVMARMFSPAPHAQAAARLRVRADGRLRLGYVSCDFAHHATMQLMAQMLERHDCEAFEVVLYSHGRDDGSAMRRRAEAACSRFVDISQMDDASAVELIRRDGIDILVDLKGYTNGTRIGIFAYRAAPVQVGFLGYPGTCGAEFLDYFIGDPVTTPPWMAEHFSEKLAQMPHCYQPNDGTRVLPVATPRSELGLPEDAFVMCSFNQSYKLTPQMFDTWCGLLRDIPGSVLWMLRTNDQVARNLAREAAMRGVDPARILYAPQLEVEQHLARLQAADVFLDSAPCSAHTTASDAMWVGLPLVTTCGETFASRVAASLLTAQGVPELVAADLGAYAAIVRGLAAHRDRLDTLRQRIAKARDTGPLFDARRFARDFEALLLRMADRSRGGLAPEHLWAGAFEH